MKSGAFEVKWSSCFADPFLSGAKRSEILRRLRHNISPQFHHNSPRWGSTNRDVKKHPRFCHGGNTKREKEEGKKEEKELIEKEKEKGEGRKKKSRRQNKRRKRKKETKTEQG